MEQIIYGDVLFIVNFSMDFLTLFLLGKIIHARIGVFSLTLASGIGALYGVITLFQNSQGVLPFIINLAVSLLMTFIAYGAPTYITLIRNTVIMYTIGFLIGGTMTAVFTFANNGLEGRNVIINGEARILYSDIPFFTFILIAGISVFLSFICGLLLKKKAENSCASVTVEFNGKNIEAKGLIDSGNLLCEPAGGLPVIVFNYTTIEPLLPIGVRPLFKESKIGLLEYADPEFAKRVRIIPVSHVGGQGIIIGLIPDKASVNGIEKRLCVACSLNTEEFEEKQCLIPSSLI